MVEKARQVSTAWRQWLLPLLVVSVLIVSVFLLVCGYLVHPVAFNSDTLYSSAQCDDLLHGRNLTDWHLPAAPYLFPDLLLLIPCQFLAPTLPITFLAYCLILHLALTATLAWLGRLSGIRWSAAIVAAGCGTIFLAASYLNKVMEYRACLLVHPASHLAALLVGLFMLAMTAHSLKSGLTRTLAAVYLLVGGFGSFSDRLVVVQLLAPLAMALILLAARSVISVRQAGVPLSLLGGSFVLSSAINCSLQRLGFHLLGLEKSSQRLRLADFFSMLASLYQGISHDYLLCTLIVLHLLAAAAIIAFWSRRAMQLVENTELKRPVILLAALTFLLSPSCILGALFLLGMAHHEAIGRYTLSCWYFPPLLLPLLAHWLPARTMRASVIVLQAGILLFALQRVAVILPEIDRERFEQPYPPLAQALDRLARGRGPLVGLGNFWAAHSTTWFTREQVVVNPMSAMGEPTFHASNPDRFFPNVDLQLPKYQFLVVRPGLAFGPSGALLALFYGPPREKITVGTDEIWLYDSLTVPVFDRFLKARLADRLHRRLSFTGPIEPACLAHPKASMTPLDAPGCIALKSNQSCEIHFAPDATGQILDVGASSEARLEATFFYGSEQLAVLPIPSVPWTGASYNKPGIQSRLLPLPPILRQRPWDRLIVRAGQDCENVHLGHVLIFAENVPGVEEEPAMPRLSSVRLEAEEMPPTTSCPLWRDEADDAASGGGVRRALANVPCCVIFTPRFFLPPGRYRLETALRVDSNLSCDEVATLLVGCIEPRKKLAECQLRGCEFSEPGRWVTQRIRFEVPENTDYLQIGIVGSGKTTFAVDYLDLIAESQDSPDEK